MPVTARTPFLLALLCLPVSAGATTVQRCEDAQGNITFTTLGCPSDQHMRLHNAYNAAPGSVINLMPESTTSSRQPIESPDNRLNKELVVVGQRDDGCGNQLNREQLRRAIINQHIIVGMNVREVESSLGKPDKIDKRPGETRYSYALKKGGSNPKKGGTAQVVFDENGCVKKGKR